ncbi:MULTISPECIES: efflux RND transporter periplasmic adaptor subunit [Olivibacter]|jgi:HlyD family secretion protein|uniref:Efflux RND transporter periplasmic adaptor subunit n=1 Tax=Olivibacter oleidegradans TaxID=760123 RepID=A0ABV6HK24_9SPHI|nr:MULTISPECIES: efflux RND transporter periplasmic adaptor subunit [Olivibacter]MDM8175267.1 efflux RND transporter periplasmic adaptor subunit [Olivibacter sp. 47]QEL02033.1 efflux RND transporter periplasmic adaptor subunit [Olivibacter sp. LS-1]
MNRKKIIIIGILILMLAVLLYFFFGRKKENGVAFETTVPEKGPIASIITSTGTIQPVDTVAVGTQVSGIIASIYTDYNAQVKKGQLLAELDPTLMQATVDQIKGQLAQAQSNFNYQQINFNRQRELFQVGAISKATYDLATNSYETAQASVNSIKAQLRSAQQNLSFTKIYSPIDGVVLNRSVSVGQTVAASFNTPTLFSLAKDITKMQVQAKVDEADIGDVQMGDRVTFTVDAYIDQTFEGKVSEIRLQPSTSNNVVTYTTIIETSNADMKLKPGMTATVTIYTKEASNVLTVPVSALKLTIEPGQVTPPYRLIENQAADTAQNAVWVLKGNQVFRQAIKVGINDNTKVQVEGGVGAKDSIITAIVSTGQGTPENMGSNPFLPTPRRRR